VKRDIVSGIYGLNVNGVTMYIGQSKNIHKRYKQHCSIAQNMGKTKKQTWLRELLKNNTIPQLEILELTQDLDNAEQRHIQEHIAKGLELVNMTGGGQTLDYARRVKQQKPWGNNHSPIQKRLIVIKRNVKIIERLNGSSAQRLRQRLNDIYKLIEIHGLETLNMKLWEKHNG
jgi:hypothetical protein